MNIIPEHKDANRRYYALATKRRRKQPATPPHTVEWQTATILLAWEAGELSEGAVARALQLGRVECRMLRDYWISQGADLAMVLAKHESLNLETPMPPEAVEFCRVPNQSLKEKGPSGNSAKPLF